MTSTIATSAKPIVPTSTVTNRVATVSATENNSAGRSGSSTSANLDASELRSR